MKTILTGIKSTGEPHLGNYVGAIRPALKLAEMEDTKSYLFIANYHSLTSIHKLKDIKNWTYSIASAYLASGLNPDKTIFYLQSDIPELFELNWILSCLSPKGLMNRAHSYKMQRDQNKEFGKKDLDDGINMGLYSYPILMASDILLFLTNEVPVGKDQKQHLEISQELAKKFNHIYKTDFFPIPKAMIQINETLPGVDGEKMSKTYNNDIPLFCDSKKLRKLIMKIQTDSTLPKEKKDPKNSTLFNIYKHFAKPNEIESLKKDYEDGIAWGEVKERLYLSLENYLKDKRKIYEDHMNNKSEIDKILKQGAEKARVKSKEVLKQIKEIIL